MNRRVALVVTGRLEHRGLATALGRLFPTAEFFVDPALSELTMRGFTSTAVDPVMIRAQAVDASTGKRRLPPAVDELVAHLAGNLCLRAAPGFVVLIEDLELSNRGNEASVVQAVRDSVSRHLAEVASARHAPQNLASALRERASFHLFDPMVEAYFYEDPVSLGLAQKGLGRPPHRVAGRDPERFEVDPSLEIAYFAPVGDCGRHRSPKDRRCPWGGEDRAVHPKKYLKYLCREEPPHEFCSTYQETDSGAQALMALDWSRALALPGSAPFLRALVEDLEDALGVAPAIAGWPATPTSTAATARWAASQQSRVLRNL